MGLRDIKITTKKWKARAPDRAVAARECLSLGLDPVVHRNKKVEDTWLSLLADPPIAHSDPNNWRQAADVRPSGFPFCPRKYVMMRLGLYIPDDFAVESNFYTEIGKAVHYVAQNALARTGRLWGFWRCARPTCSELYDKTKPSFMPEECPQCQAVLFEYEEISLRDDDIGLRGNTDGILIFKNRSAILEVKTADDEKVTNMKGLSDESLRILFQAEHPYFGYWHQASTYASLARKRFPQLPPLTHVEYLIFSRSSPKNVAAISMEVPADDSWYKEIKARVLMAKKAKELKVLPEGFASKESDLSNLPTCKWCQYNKVCMRPEEHFKHKGDARQDSRLKQQLADILEEARFSMGTIIRGDVVESTDVLVPEPPQDNKKKEKADEDSSASKSQDDK